MVPQRRFTMVGMRSAFLFGPNISCSMTLHPISGRSIGTLLTKKGLVQPRLGHCCPGGSPLLPPTIIRQKTVKSQHIESLFSYEFSQWSHFVVREVSLYTLALKVTHLCSTIQNTVQCKAVNIALNLEFSSHYLCHTPLASLSLFTNGGITKFVLTWVDPSVCISAT